MADFGSGGASFVGGAESPESVGAGGRYAVFQWATLFFAAIISIGDRARVYLGKI